jgi:hypothetical protein
MRLLRIDDLMIALTMRSIGCSSAVMFGGSVFSDLEGGAHGRDVVGPAVVEDEHNLSRSVPAIHGASTTSPS